MNVRARRAIEMILCFFLFFFLFSFFACYLFWIMRTISESLSCNLPRCKGTPERTTCGKKPTRRKGVTTVTEPAFAGKKRMRVRSIARAIVFLDQLPSERAIFFFYYPFFSSIFIEFLFSFFRFFSLFLLYISFANPRTRAFPVDPRARPGSADGLFRLRHQLEDRATKIPRVLLAMFRTRHYRNNRRRHTLIKRTHHTRDPSSHAT